MIEEQKILDAIEHLRRLGRGDLADDLDFALQMGSTRTEIALALRQSISRINRDPELPEDLRASLAQVREGIEKILAA